VFVARLVSAVGDKFFAIALAWYALARPGSRGNLELAVVMTADVLPVVLLGPLGGLLADRFDRRRCMISADGARMLLAGAMALFIHLDRIPLPLLLALCFLQSSFIPLFESALASSLEDLTDRDHVGRAVALDGMVVQLSMLIGAAAGSLVLAWIATAGAFLVNSISFGVSLLAVALVRTRLAPRGRPQEGDGIRAAFRRIRGIRGVLSLVAVFGGINFFAAPLVVFIPMLVRSRLNRGVRWVAILEVLLAAGSVGSGFAMGLRRGQRHVYVAMCVALAGLGLSIAALGGPPRRLLIGAALFCAGASLSTINTLALSLFQEVIPADLKGRFFALLTTVCFAIMPVTYLVQGAVSQALPVERLLLVDGTLVTLGALLLLALPRIKDHLGARAEAEMAS
jgi:MFS transporter, DHA3 family, macrolide efflux protein